MTGAAGLEKLKALIVEDNVHMRQLLRSLLNSLGIKQTIEAEDGHRGIAILRETRCDLILTDLAMAPMNGIEFTRYLRNSSESANRFVPIIMITAHTEKHLVEAARDAGISELLAKPVTVQGLVSRISEILERPRSFVQSSTYFGPDRRRRLIEGYAGPWRRQEDIQDMAVV